MRTVRPIRPGPFGSRRRSSWPLTGRTGTAAPGGRPSSRAVGAPAATRTAPAATVVPSSSATPVTRSPVDHEPGGGRAGADGPAGGAHRRLERRDEPARVDGVVARDLERQPHGRGQRGLQAAGAASGAAARPPGRRAGGRRSGGRAPRPRRGRAPRRACRSRAGRGRARRSRRAARRRRGSRRTRAGSTRAAAPRRTAPRRRARACPRRRATRRARRRRARRRRARAARRTTRSRGRSGHRRRRRRPAWLAPPTELAHSFPTPARPGSGSTVGAPMAPSQPDCGLPYGGKA